MAGIIAPVVLDVPKVLPEKWQARVSRCLPQPRRVRLALITGLLGLVVAAFLAFHDERTRIDKPVLVGLRYIDTPTPSTNEQFPYGLQVVVQTDSILKSPTIILVFDGDVGNGTYRIQGAVTSNTLRSGILVDNPNTYLVEIEKPDIRPETPIIFKIFSKSLIKVVDVLLR